MCDESFWRRSLALHLSEIDFPGPVQTKRDKFSRWSLDTGTTPLGWIFYVPVFLPICQRSLDTEKLFAYRAVSRSFLSV